MRSSSPPGFPPTHLTNPVRYHLTDLGRFLIISLPLLIVVMGLFTLALHATGFAPSMAALEARGLARPEALPLGISAGGWLIEALALTALFLLIQGRAGAWWMDGLIAGMIGWVFRGPILVLSIVSLSRLGSEPWWQASLRWLLLYSLCGLVLAITARAVHLER
jgi:hypothetical protein